MVSGVIGLESEEEEEAVEMVAEALEAGRRTLPIDLDSDEMVAAIDRVLKACQKNNVIPGIVTATAEDAARRIKQGFQLVTCMNDLGFFCSRTKQHIQSVRELAARP